MFELIILVTLSGKTLYEPVNKYETQEECIMRGSEHSEYTRMALNNIDNIVVSFECVGE